MGKDIERKRNTVLDRETLRIIESTKLGIQFQIR